MRRGTVLEVATLASVGAGLLAISSLGGWLPIATAFSMVAIIAAAGLRRSIPRLPWAPITAVSTIAALVVPLMVGGTVFDAIAAACLSLQLCRRWARSGPTDDRTSAVIALLMLVLAAALDPAALVGLGALSWVIATPVVAVLTFLEAAGSRTARERRVVSTHLVWISLAVVSLTVIIFVALPRFRSSDLGLGANAPDATIGFSDHVDLGEVGSLLDDPTPVMSLRLPAQAPPPTYMRGLVLDTFDGRAWTATIANADPQPTRTEAGYRVDITQEASAGPVAFAPGPALFVDGPFVADQAGSWRLTGQPRRVEYSAWVGPPAKDVSDFVRWTTLPELDPRIAALAAEVVPGRQSSLQAADAIARWLDAETQYTRAPRNGETEAPLATFLFESREGHCEYYATAAAVLLRSLGHSARVVNGYANPEPLGPDGAYLVRQGHAHAWIEVRDADGIWHTVDPTPGGSRPPLVTLWQRASDLVTQQWTSRVLAYDGTTQVRTLQGAAWWVQSRVTGRDPSGAVPWIGLVVLVMSLGGLTTLVVSAIQRLAKRLAGEADHAPLGPVARAHARGRKLLLKNGWKVPPALPPVDAANWLAEHLPEAGATLRDLAWLHYRVRYGGESDSVHIAEARGLLTRLRSQLMRPPAADRRQR